MTVLDNILKALDLFLEALDQFWEIGLHISEQIVNSTPYLTMSPVAFLGTAIILFTVWLRL